MRQAHAVSRPVLGSGPPEQLEDPALVLLRDTAAIILDFDHYAIVAPGAIDVDPPLFVTS